MTAQVDANQAVTGQAQVAHHLDELRGRARQAVQEDDRGAVRIAAFHYGWRDTVVGGTVWGRKDVLGVGLSPRLRGGSLLTIGRALG